MKVKFAKRAAAAAMAAMITMSAAFPPETSNIRAEEPETEAATEGMPSGQETPMQAAEVQVPETQTEMPSLETEPVTQETELEEVPAETVATETQELETQEPETQVPETEVPETQETETQETQETQQTVVPETEAPEVQPLMIDNMDQLERGDDVPYVWLELEPADAFHGLHGSVEALTEDELQDMLDNMADDLGLAGADAYIGFTVSLYNMDGSEAVVPEGAYANVGSFGKTFLSGYGNLSLYSDKEWWTVPYEAYEDADAKDRYTSMFGLEKCGTYIFWKEADTQEAQDAQDVEDDSTTDGEDPEDGFEFLCGKEEHAHTDACFDEDGNVVCGMEEHTHTETCLEAPEVQDEQDAEDVLETEGFAFLCGKEEHTHTDACFDGDGNVVCGLDEHTHTEPCLEAETSRGTVQETEPVEGTTESFAFLCGKEEHTHTDACLDGDGNVVCGLEEHVHSEACLEGQETEMTEATSEEETEAEPESETESETETGTELDPGTDIEFTCEGEGVSVKALVRPEAGIPEDAQLHADKIEEGTPAYEAAASTVKESLNAGPDDSFFFEPYDVYFTDTEGNRLEPETGMVQVSMEFAKDPFAGLDGGDAEKFVAHILGNGSVEKLDIDGTGEGGKGNSALSFETGSFSVMGPAALLGDGDTPYAILYNNGDLVLQLGDAEDTTKGGVRGKWTGFDTLVNPYTTDWPWYNDRMYIKKVLFTADITFKSMALMFYSCTGLESVEFQVAPDLSSVTNMRDMFSSCYNLKNIDLSALDLSSVTNMEGMFSGCERLSSINLSGLDLSSVTNMEDMFWRCEQLSRVNLNDLDLSSVTNMEEMFRECKYLSSIDLSGLNLGSVASMGYMFRECEYLNSVNFGAIDLSSVTNMEGMFYNCPALSSVDLGGFDLSSVTDMSSMFSGCYRLGSVNFKNCLTSSISDISSMFRDCTNFTDVDISSFNFANNVNTERTFWNDPNLKSITVGPSFKFDGSTVYGTWTNGSVTKENYELPDVGDASGTWTRVDSRKNPYPSWIEDRVEWSTPGNLKITKKVAEGGDQEKEFRFRLILENYPKTISLGTNKGDLQFHNGVAEFTLKHGEELEIDKFPMNAIYTVQEPDAEADGYKATISGYNEDGHGVMGVKESHSYTFTNEVQPYGSLSVTKSVKGNAADTKKRFSFTVSVEKDGAPIPDGAYGGMTFKSGNATFTLADGETVTAKDLPDGASYAVTEDDYKADGYNTSSKLASGTIKAGTTAKAEFENTKSISHKTEVSPGNGVSVKPGSTIKYRISYENPGSSPMDIVVTDKLDAGVDLVKASAGSVSLTGEGKQSASGTEISYSTHTVTWKLSGVPAGTEDSYAELEVKVRSDAGRKVDNKATVQFGNVNAIDTETVSNPITYISFKKTGIGGAGLAGAQMELKDAGGNTVHSWVSTDGTDRIYVEPGTYTVHEAKAPDGYLAAPDITVAVDSTGKMTVAGDTVDPVVMEDDWTKLKIRKEGPDGNLIAGAKLSVYKKADMDGNKPLAGAAAVYSWTTDANEHPVDAKLTAGVEYVLVEDAAPDGYLVAEPVPFTVNTDGAVQTVKMTDPYADTDVPFRKVGPDGKVLAGAVLKVTGREDKATADISPITWTTSASETQHVLKLKAGSYVLHEVSAPEGYALAEDIPFTVKPDRAIAEGGKTVTEIVMEDGYLYKGLSVSKTVAGNMGDKAKSFNFTLKLTVGGTVRGDALPYQKGSEKGSLAAGADGLYHFQLAHGETISFTGIRYGTVYEVKETDGITSGYEVSEENASGTVKTEDVSASFTNTKNVGIPTDANGYMDGWETAMLLLAIMLVCISLYTGVKHKKEI